MHPNRVPVLILSFLLALPCPASAGALQGSLLAVFDGDTFLVRLDGRKEYVRLREIDAPEASSRKRAGQEPWGKRARDFARSRLKNNLLRLEIEENDERDGYRRLLAYVFAGDRLVNEELIRSGNAFFYPGRFRGKYASRLERAEAEARRDGMGVWHRKKGLRERPQNFRDRAQRDESVFSPARPGTGKINRRDR